MPRRNPKNGALKRLFKWILKRLWDPGPDFWILVTVTMVLLALLVVCFLTGKSTFAERVLIPLFTIWFPLVVKRGIEDRRKTGVAERENAPLATG